MQRQSQAMHNRFHTRPPWHLSIVIVLLGNSILRNSCNGMYESAPFQIFLTQTMISNVSPILITSWNSGPLIHIIINSVLAAIKSAAQKYRRRMPQTVAKRQMFHQSARTHRDLGRITCHRHEPHFHSCQILQQRRVEVGRVEGEEQA